MIMQKALVVKQQDFREGVVSNSKGIHAYACQKTITVFIYDRILNQMLCFWAI